MTARLKDCCRKALAKVNRRRDQDIWARHGWTEQQFEEILMELARDLALGA